MDTSEGEASTPMADVPDAKRLVKDGRIVECGRVVDEDPKWGGSTMWCDTKGMGIAAVRSGTSFNIRWDGLE